MNWLQQLPTGDLVLAFFTLLIAYLRQQTKKIDASPPVVQAQKRVEAAQDAQGAIKQAVDANDAAWQTRWDAREEEWKGREKILVDSFNTIVETNRVNAESHESSMQRFSQALEREQGHLASVQDELADSKARIGHLEAEVKQWKTSCDNLRRQYDEERLMWRRTTGDQKLRMDDMTRRAQAAGVHFTATDVLREDGQS